MSLAQHICVNMKDLQTNKNTTFVIKAKFVKR